MSEKIICTYCNGSEFFEGPSGGLCVNVLCANPSCRHWFNSTPFGLEDLNRVEPTKEEKQALRQSAEAELEQKRQDRIAEGKKAYHDHKPIENLQYGPYDLDRVIGFISAMSEDRRGA